ncbi:MAG: diguanylate cyclase [Pseudomonadota bacterium]
MIRDDGVGIPSDLKEQGMGLKIMQYRSTEVEKADRYGRQLTLAIFDLDHIKNINDLYGHPAGDHVLRETGNLILKMIRQGDIACRYGGEEIAIIMPDTGSRSSLMTCERILEGIRSHLMVFAGKHL